MGGIGKGLGSLWSPGMVEGVMEGDDWRLIAGSQVRLRSLSNPTGKCPGNGNPLHTGEQR